MAKYNEQDNDEYLLKHNLLGIDCYQELERAESFVFSLRATDFERGGFVLRDYSMEEFKKLHHYLFQDIYPFAGEFRDVQLMKGNTRFCQVQFLNDYAIELFRQLKTEPSWKSLDEAAEHLAYFKSELNMLHPFREGNGRTTRIFIHPFSQLDCSLIKPGLSNSRCLLIVCSISARSLIGSLVLIISKSLYLLFSSRSQPASRKENIHNQIIFFHPFIFLYSY